MAVFQDGDKLMLGKIIFKMHLKLLITQNIPVIII